MDKSDNEKGKITIQIMKCIDCGVRCGCDVKYDPSKSREETLACLKDAACSQCGGKLVKDNSEIKKIKQKMQCLGCNESFECEATYFADEFNEEQALSDFENNLCPKCGGKLTKEDFVFIGEWSSDRKVDSGENIIDKQEKVPPPKELINISEDGLLEQMLSYFKKEFGYEAPDRDGMPPPQWIPPGELKQFLISQYSIDPYLDWESEWYGQVTQKVSKAFISLRTKWEIYVREEENNLFDKERNELPNLVEKCVDWARQLKLKRLSLSDIEAFLVGSDITILNYPIKRMLYLQSNAKLKSE